MRIRSGVALLAACLCLTGCSLFGKKSGAGNPAPRNPTDGPAPPALGRPPAPAETTSNPSPGSGVLAGQILDRYNRHPGGVLIRVTDLEDTRQPAAAPIERQADEQGYFTIAGLRPGGHYQLVARGQDGEHLLSGSLLATPPNPRLTIWVSEEAGAPATSPVTQGPVYPGKPDGARQPAATLERPIKEPAASAGTPSPVNPQPAPGPTPAAGTDQQPPAASGQGTLDPSRITGPPPPKSEIQGFDRAPESPPVNIPNQNVLPPPPGSSQLDPQPRNNAPRPVAPPPGPISQAPAERPPVPSCQLVGRRLVNLALYDVYGNAWEYRRDQKGRPTNRRLVLIDFWNSHCGPCLDAMQHIVQLHQQYAPWGLEVVGIAYEKGTIDQQVSNVRSIRGRYQIRYPTLLGAGANCPVKTQFDVQAFPTLVLLDENGDIVFRREGLSERDYYELVYEVRRRLNIR